MRCGQNSAAARDPSHHRLRRSVQFAHDAIAPVYRRRDARIPLIGGMASSGRQPGENILLRNDAAYQQGFVGISLSGPVDVQTLVSQGCRPIGKPMVITKSHDNLVEQLGGKPALKVLQETVNEMEEGEREQLANGLFLGRAISEYKERFGRGDFLVRNVMGVDERTARSPSRNT